MSATAQNCVYNFGKKKDGAKDPVMSAKRLEEIKKNMEKYLSTKK